MNCLELRQALTAEPGRRTPELEQHLAGCSACARYAAELERFERLLKQALEVPVPAAAAKLPAARPRFGRYYALAASGLLAAVVGAALWSFYPRTALATALVEHVVREPDSWAPRAEPLPAESLAYVLGRSGVALAPGAAFVTYASSCWFRGWHVPHLVVQGPHGPVTVMVLRHETVGRVTAIDEGGYRGVIAPAHGRGALVLLARDPAAAADLDVVVARVSAAVSFVD